MIPSILNKLLNYDCLIFILDLKQAELIYMSKILEIGLHELTISKIGIGFIYVDVLCCS